MLPLLGVNGLVYIWEVEGEWEYMALRGNLLRLLGLA